MNRLIEYVREHIADDAPLIVAGDFNDWRLKCHHRLQAELGLQEAHQSVQGNLAKTYPANLPILAMDRIYQLGFEVLEGRILDSKVWRRMSDYRGLIIELAFKA